MKYRFSIVLIVFFAFLTVFSPQAFSVTFTTGDLTGTWLGHQIVTGDAQSDEPRWGYGTITIDGSGNFSSIWTSPGSTNEVSSGSIEINTDGIFTVNNQSLTHGVMNDAKDLMVFIDGTPTSEGNALFVFMKRGSGITFTNADLSGTWYGHQVVSGDAPHDDPRSGYGTVTIDNSGNYTAVWSSTGSTSEVSNGSAQLNSDGTFTLNNQNLVHGAVNDEKDLMVFIDGTVESQGSAFFVLVKRQGGIPFTGSDLAGEWYGHHVVSGDAPGDDPRCGYGKAVIDSSGAFSATWTSPTRTNEISNGSIQVNSAGIFTINNHSLTHGTIGDSKDILVFVDATTESQGNALNIFIRRSQAVTTGSNLLLLKQTP